MSPRNLRWSAEEYRPRCRSYGLRGGPSLHSYLRGPQRADRSCLVYRWVSGQGHRRAPSGDHRPSLPNARLLMSVRQPKSGLLLHLLVTLSPQADRPL
ncbi:hypothetical protein Y717_15035 [Streptomyces scopuliridis RB72]|uniref:Uncharacterized protein n=1 Tax=Streptomyces scopuliridis RB72 TaxID=1440053 RepID=A0A2T7T4W2_9ACTN|nr:hypothetical protein Y717_15035 [Streptomyces scopuliridis RB72]